MKATTTYTKNLTVPRQGPRRRGPNLCTPRDEEMLSIGHLSGTSSAPTGRICTRNASAFGGGPRSISARSPRCDGAEGSLPLVRFANGAIEIRRDPNAHSQLGHRPAAVTRAASAGSVEYANKQELQARTEFRRPTGFACGRWIRALFVRAVTRETCGGRSARSRA